MPGANAMEHLKEIDAKIKSAASNMKSNLGNEAKVRCSNPSVVYAQVCLPVYRDAGRVGVVLVPQNAAKFRAVDGRLRLLPTLEVRQQCSCRCSCRVHVGSVHVGSVHVAVFMSQAVFMSCSCRSCALTHRDVCVSFVTRS